MDLFFEERFSRRAFLGRCGLFILGGMVLPRLLRSSSTSDSDVGWIQPHGALYYEKVSGDMVRCSLCPRRCLVGKGKRGFCRVRENRDGDYYTLVHSNPCSLHIDPIEKKPLFHFLPGTAVLSLATAGCNFTCKNCQNWDISQASPEDTYNYRVPPNDVVGLALKYKTPTIAFTYTEPTVFYEYMLETARAAKKEGLRSIYHSNGYINEDPLRNLTPFLDGANIDLKGYSESFYKEITGGTLGPVLETLKILKKQKVWLEITNLLIPTKNDAEGMIKDLCAWVKDELGKETPIHFSRFYPQYKMLNLPPTPVETLRTAARLARESGLEYIYIGNVPGIEEESTYCPQCGKIIIERRGYDVRQINLSNGRCKYCKKKIPGLWLS